ncbi:uroporphyrinogen-III synthase [Sulfobacillus harzensis]|uniref:Uroporphyrinogen-III synthase n=1 Tax=Sulfobacillus harzensis TaxID=2729629 RepID=A0A7Y0Q351_9FIRM|nr:uroporphyrinogen-III synthase [Sulfobacillus harzensis]NMP23853.1 uroporphyrinogen-III synthase [Sulfobacillus harzensis]
MQVLTIVGGGPGNPELLTQAAETALDRAEIIYVGSGALSALDGHADWLRRVRSEEDLAEEFRLDGIQAAWLVPGTPSLCPAVKHFLEKLDPTEWQHVSVVSGIPEAISMLDEEGWMIPAQGAALTDGSGRELLVWRNHRWSGMLANARIAWRQKKPLAGRKLAVLRSGAKSRRMVRWLEEWGAEVILCPVSRLVDPPSWESCDRVIERVERFDWVIFTSGEAVERWFERMRSTGQDVRQLRAKIAVVGPETAVRVRERGLVPELMPESEYSQEGLAQAFSAVPVRGSVVLFPGGQKNRTFLGDYLRGRGALVEELLIYENQPAPLEVAFYQALKGGSLDGILFTASSQVEYLIDQLKAEDRRHLARVASFSIGPLTSRTLMHYGLEAKAEASEPSLRLLAECVKSYFVKENDNHVSH